MPITRQSQMTSELWPTLATYRPMCGNDDGNRREGNGAGVAG
jgi:hypothetical protein